MTDLVAFDGAAKLIIVSVGVTEIDVEADVYSAWKRWMLLSDNSKWPIAMRTVGGDPLSETKTLGATFFLLNSWRIRPQEADHWLTVNGNLYTDPAGASPFVSTLGAFTVTISMVVSNLSDASLAQMSEIEQASFEGAITINLYSGVPGTTYPTGTLRQPCDNLADAQAIGRARGISGIRVIGNLTVGAAESLSRWHVFCDDADYDTITLTPGCTTDGVKANGLRLTGTANGLLHVHDCILEDLDGVEGLVQSSVLRGTVTCASDTAFYGCFDGVNPGSARIDLGGSGKRIEIRDYWGGLTLLNKTGPEEVTIAFSAGRLVIDSSVTGGTIVARGVGEISANDGTAALNSSGLISNASIWDIPNGVETGLTQRQAMRLVSAALAGKVSGAATTEISIRDVNDTKDRIVAEVDSDGNRIVVVLDAD